MADRDDNYRGYGRPSGRYYEGREYGRGGERNRFADPGRDDDRGLFGGGRDRDDDRGGLFGRDRDDHRGYRGRDDDRGFFERAGEQVRSWFSDDDDRYDRTRNRDDDRTSYQSRDRGYGLGSTYSGGRGRDDDYRGDTRYGGKDEQRGSRYGATSGFGAGSRQNQYGDSHPHDSHYGEWRNEQLSAFDRDYDEYRRENREKFHSEFSNWRGQRQQQRSSLRQVQEHMEVVGSDGQPVGTVDKVAGDKIILTKNGPNAGGHHHSIPCGWIQSVDDRVTINKTAEQAREKWTDEETRRALFETDEQRRDDGPHILDRSFSGTYGN